MFNQTKFIVAGVGGTIAFAQGPTPSPSGNAWMNLYWQTLAQKLGTTVEKLQQAMTDARTEAAQEGVKQGVDASASRPHSG